MTCESLNCFCVKENATVGFIGPAAKVMKFKIAHVQLYTKLQECTLTHNAQTHCVLHNYAMCTKQMMGPAATRHRRCISLNRKVQAHVY